MAVLSGRLYSRTNTRLILARLLFLGPWDLPPIFLRKVNLDPLAFYRISLPNRSKRESRAFCLGKLWTGSSRVLN